MSYQSLHISEKYFSVYFSINNLLIIPLTHPCTHPFISYLINVFHISTGFVHQPSHQQVWPQTTTVTLPRTLFPGENISAGEIQRTEPAGIWHFSDISILPSPFFVHTPTCKQYDGFTQKLGFFLTMGDWEVHNLLQDTGSKMQDLRISRLLDLTPCFPPTSSGTEMLHGINCVC